MERVNGADTVDIGGGNRGFRAQNALVGINGTEVTDTFLNAVQEEICAVIENTGIELDEEDNTQLWQALRRLINSLQKTSDLAVKAWQSAPPVAPSVGDTYVIKSGALGVWAGHNHQIAIWTGASWQFNDPLNGLQANFNDGGRFAVIWYDGSVWAQVSGSVKPAVITTFYVNANGTKDFVNLTACFEYLRGFVIPANAEVIIKVETNLHEPAPVDMYHSDGGRISIHGPVMIGAFPTFANFTGNVANDANMLRGRFGAVITCAVATNVANIIGGQIKEIRDLLFIGASSGAGVNSLLQVGEVENSRFNKTGSGAVFLRRCWFHGGGIPLFLRRNAELTWENIGISHAYGPSGLRVAQGSYASSITGALKIFYCTSTGAQAWYASSIVAPAGSAEIRNCGGNGLSTDWGSLAVVDGGSLANNGNNNLTASNGSFIDATGAATTAAGSGTSIRAVDGSHITASGSTGQTSPAINTVGNNNSFISR